MAVPLVVGIDGSQASLEAVDWAADEALRHDVPLHLLHAGAADHDASDLVAAASERARKSAPAVRLSSEVLFEDAASALVSDGRNALALVLGSRGLGGLAGLLLGSVSLAVAARADCPVVVVRGGGGAPARRVRVRRHRGRGRGRQRYCRGVRVPRGPRATLSAPSGARLERPGREPRASRPVRLRPPSPRPPACPGACRRPARSREAVSGPDGEERGGGGLGTTGAPECRVRC